MGVHSGPLVLGSVGSAWRKDYTVIGDTVNVASRLEALTRQLDADVLVSESTCQAAGEGLAAEPVGPVTVKGREESVGACARLVGPIAA